MEEGSDQGALSLDTHTFASRTLEPQQQKYLSVSVPFSHPAVGEMHQGKQVVDAGLHAWAVGSSGQVIQGNPHRKKIYLEYNYLETIIQ